MESPFTVSGGYIADMPLAVGVFSYQIIIIFILTVAIDHCLRNRYKKRGGKEGKKPKHLLVHDDVKKHENEVRAAENL